MHMVTDDPYKVNSEMYLRKVSTYISNMGTKTKLFSSRSVLLVHGLTRSNRTSLSLSKHTLTDICVCITELAKQHITSSYISLKDFNH